MMRKLGYTTAFFFFFPVVSHAADFSPNPRPLSATYEQARVIENYCTIPLTFTINNGQYDPQAKFVTRGSSCILFFTQEEDNIHVVL